MTIHIIPPATQSGKKQKKVTNATSVINNKGRLTVPSKVISMLNFNPESENLLVATPRSKSARFHHLLLLPCSKNEPNSHELKRNGLSRLIDLKHFLVGCNCDYENYAFKFRVESLPLKDHPNAVRLVLMTKTLRKKKLRQSISQKSSMPANLPSFMGF